MKKPVIEMLNRYNCETPEDHKNALKEIMQEVALLGLSRQNFFKKAAFYGGTALRIAHNLDRFSEDLDFTLVDPTIQFDLNSYLPGIQDEFSSLGLKLSCEQKVKSVYTSIESAFLKSNTLQNLLLIEGLNNPASGTNRNEVIKIKLEIDTKPPLPTGEFETKTLFYPIPFSYKILTLPSLFSGKLHAILCRDYKSGRVKGRDFFDFIWYKSKKIEPDMDYLEGKLLDSGHWVGKKKFTEVDLSQLLREKFEETNWELAKLDVEPFVRDRRALDVWSEDFFKSLI